MQNTKLPERGPADQPVDIDERTYRFALRIVGLCRKMDAVPGVHRTMARQLLRSGTSVGANVEEAQSAKSRADFVAKLSIALKEARETHYWLRLVRDASLEKPEPLAALVQEADEIKRILATIIRNTKENAKK
jgi:four helix bundle protein